MSKKRAARNKKVFRAATQRRKARMGGAFARAAERRKKESVGMAPPTRVDTTPKPKKGSTLRGVGIARKGVRKAKIR